MIEIPEKYDTMTPSENGFRTVQIYFNGLAGRTDRYLLAKKIVEGKNKEELIEYIAQIFLGVEAVKVKAGGLQI